MFKLPNRATQFTPQKIKTSPSPKPKRNEEEIEDDEEEDEIQSSSQNRIINNQQDGSPLKEKNQLLTPNWKNHFRDVQGDGKFLSTREKAREQEREKERERIRKRIRERKEELDEEENERKKEIERQTQKLEEEIQREMEMEMKIEREREIKWKMEKDIESKNQIELEDTDIESLSQSPRFDRWSKPEQIEDSSQELTQAEPNLFEETPLPSKSIPVSSSTKHNVLFSSIQKLNEPIEESSSIHHPREMKMEVDEIYSDDDEEEIFRPRVLFPNKKDEKETKNVLYRRVKEDIEVDDENQQIQKVKKQSVDIDMEDNENSTFQTPFKRKIQHIPEEIDENEDPTQIPKSMISSEIKQKSTPKFRFQEAPLPMEISTPIDFSSPTKRKKRLKGGYAEKLTRILHQQKSLFALWERSLEDNSSHLSKSFLFMINTIKKDGPLLVTSCSLFQKNELSQEYHEPEILFHDPEDQYDFTEGGVVKVYQPWTELRDQDNCITLFCPLFQIQSSNVGSYSPKKSNPFSFLTPFGKAKSSKELIISDSQSQSQSQSQEQSSEIESLNLDQISSNETKVENIKQNQNPIQSICPFPNFVDLHCVILRLIPSFWYEDQEMHHQSQLPNSRIRWLALVVDTFGSFCIIRIKNLDTFFPNRRNLSDIEGKAFKFTKILLSTKLNAQKNTSLFSMLKDLYLSPHQTSIPQFIYQIELTEHSTLSIEENKDFKINSLNPPVLLLDDVINGLSFSQRTKLSRISFYATISSFHKNSSRYSLGNVKVMDKSIKQTDELCINIQNRVIFDLLIQELQLQSQDLLIFFFRDIEFIEGTLCADWLSGVFLVTQSQIDEKNQGDIFLYQNNSLIYNSFCNIDK